MRTEKLLKYESSKMETQSATGLCSVHLPIRLCLETQQAMMMWLLTHKNKRQVAHFHLLILFA